MLDGDWDEKKQSTNLSEGFCVLFFCVLITWVVLIILLFISCVFFSMKFPLI